jgi:hypothetical protein
MNLNICSKRQMTKMMLEFKDVRLARKLGQSMQETYVQSVITSAVV